MKTAIIQARVSSDEQAKGYSLDVQINKLVEHCKVQNIEILRTFREDHSAKSFNRPEFNKALKFVKENKGKVDLMLFTTWDRFSRNVTASFSMLETLRKYGVEVQAIEQPLDLKVPENLMILSVFLALPDIDNQRRSIKITEGVRAAKASGRWLGKAPFGYENRKDERNKPIIIPGSKAEIVKYLFCQIALGKTQSELREELKKQGMRFSRSTLSDLLRNRVYVGEIYVPRGKSENGYYVKGLHQPIIEMQLFIKVQQIMESKLNAKGFVKAKTFKDEFPLRGLLKCAYCNGNLTASSPKGRNGYHSYYHCSKCKLWIPSRDVHDKIIRILEEIKITKSVNKLYQLMVKKLISEKQSSKKRSQSTIEHQLVQYKQRIINIEDDLADRKIDNEAYNRTIMRYRVELSKLERELLDNSNNQTKYEKYIKTGIDVLQNLPGFYQKASIEIKRKLIGSIFPESLVLDKKNCRTTNINEAVRLILATDKGLGEINSGQLFKNLQLSGNVEVTVCELLFLKFKN